MRTFRVLIIAMLMQLVFSAHGQDVSRIDRFQLWNDCEPVRLFVEDLSQDAIEIGLRKEDIETAVRSRLRSARIYSSEETGQPFVFVRVAVFTSAISYNIELFKFVFDPLSEKNYGAITWETGSVGTHGNNANFIISSLSQATDEFVDEYLRVNEEACD